MKTTLNIDETVMAELKREAARQGRTMSEMVETALRLLLRAQRKRGTIPALPRFRSGGALGFDRAQVFGKFEGQGSALFHVALHRFLVAAQGIAFVGLAEAAAFDIQEQLYLPRPEGVAVHIAA